PRTAGLPQNAVSCLPQSSKRLPHCAVFLAVSSYGGVHCSPSQLPRLPYMTGVSLGVRCESQSKALFGLAGIPLLLLRHRRHVCSKKGKSVECVVEHEIIRFSRLRLMDDLARLVETLQGKSEVGEIRVQIQSIRC